ncbi:MULTISPECIES: NUMOD4 domain-containing protein [unclassified Flavobacterium]|uniref:NUMOD4 domain-containing protein n=1 Tax=unclassified Flavobacterium TaxID=196869 RepID=UPI001F129DE9|nr:MULTISPECIES: NUMOD4 domain-containing protein [unclassified Flavobacterium]UMY65865.1 NUMOD4 domain-containing protein [Flavobacterium sp. HJ-32-4]HLN96203.1 NUMOD4 domain-containing protein [Flavobacterium sp.]
MLRLYASERFVEVPLDAPLQKRYAVSNYGRIISYTDKMENGQVIKGGRSEGYVTLRYKFKYNDTWRSKSFFVAKLVAEYFIPKDHPDQTYVLHLDYQRDNDRASNLKWATKDEMIEHAKKSPHVISARQRTIAHNIASDGAKLTTTQVIRLKKELANPNRKTRLKMLAKQFNISEMQLYRIKRGENWGHIKV